VRETGLRACRESDDPEEEEMDAKQAKQNLAALDRTREQVVTLRDVEGVSR
jgi:hypothetical protein